MVKGTIQIGLDDFANSEVTRNFLKASLLLEIERQKKLLGIN